MRSVWMGCKILMLFSLVTIGEAEIYIVTVEGEPVISYKGGVDGFKATAVESDEKIDVTSPPVDLPKESPPAASEAPILPSSSDFSVSSGSTTSPLLESVSPQPDSTSDQ
ncbi:hypothetical protein U1Q18_026613, partial [Sarracenia purpurea var. burkii]